MESLVKKREREGELGEREQERVSVLQNEGGEREGLNKGVRSVGGPRGSRGFALHLRTTFMSNHFIQTNQMVKSQWFA